MEHLEWLLSLAANTAIIIFEFIGVGIIIYSGLTSFLKFLRRSPDTKIYLAKGLAMGLEFKMGSEILRTVVVREWKEIGIVAGIIVLRAALTKIYSNKKIVQIALAVSSLILQEPSRRLYSVWTCKWVNAIPYSLLILAVSFE